MKLSSLILSALLFGVFLFTCACEPAANTNTAINTNSNRANKNENISRFSFPPPKPSAEPFEVPREVLLKSGGQMADVENRLSSALKENGYRFRYHAIQNGFAIVTSIQQFRLSDLKSISDKEKVPPPEDFSEYRKHLIEGKRGYFRALIITVTTEDFAGEHLEQSPTFENARNWITLGGSKKMQSNPELKGTMGNPFTDKHHCHVYLYVFEKNVSSNTTVFLDGFEKSDVYLQGFLSLLEK